MSLWYVHVYISHIRPLLTIAPLSQTVDSVSDVSLPDTHVSHERVEPAGTDTSDTGDNRVSGPLITFLFSRMLEKFSSVVILMQKISLCI